MEIKCSNLNFYFDKKTKDKVIDSVNLKIKANTIVGITGKSGSGKTTFAELLMGLIIPTSGKITIDDVIINKKNLFDKDKLYRKIVFVSQNSDKQIFNKTVKDELLCSLKFLNKSVSDEQISKILTLVGLNEFFLDKNPLCLSYGEKRKLMIASSLLLDTEIIIFDEPSYGLDYKSVKDFIRLVKDLKNNYGKTIIVISRDVDFIHKISNQVVIFDHGKVIIDGDKYEVFRNVALLDSYNIPIPKLIAFSNLVLSKKNIKIGYRDEINDLLKDIYRYVR